MKKALREYGKAMRNRLSKEEHKHKSDQILMHLLPLIKNKKMIGIYLPIQNEVDITALCEQKFSFALPKVRDAHTMDFYLVSNIQEVEKGHFQLLEPISNVCLKPNDLECILVPMVAFDEQMHRIGYGKGYYDQYLKQSKALTIGIAFECQKVADIMVEEHDVRLDFIVSEQGVHYRI